MKRFEFFSLVSCKFTPAEITKIACAYQLAKEFHRGQSRDTGERYFEHTRRVAVKLITLNPSLDCDEVIVGLLHDLVEDCCYPDEFLEVIFGPRVRVAVLTLSKYIPITDSETGHIKQKRRIESESYFAAIQEAELLVRRCKVADRIDNVNSFACWPAERRRRYIEETERYILPIAEITDRHMHAELLALTEVAKTAL